MPNFIDFRINHDLLREVIRLKDERGRYILEEGKLPKVLSATKRNYNQFPISYIAWREHLSNVSKVRNFGNLKLDLQVDYSNKTPQPERKPLTEAQKKRLKALSYKPAQEKKSIRLEVFDTVAA
jgi:hypothetical protein